jgi:hypothetical protein
MQKAVGSIPARDILNIEIEHGLLKGWWFDPWQDSFKYFIISMYK